MNQHIRQVYTGTVSADLRLAGAAIRFAMERETIGPFIQWMKTEHQKIVPNCADPHCLLRAATKTEWHDTLESALLRLAATIQISDKMDDA